ncbi:MAG: SMC-Scp complex subunit ScpB [Caldilineaceae bacterium]|nr:SMC-Scp complex subunit ScpB [Caldilineaceae bacterium]
MALTAALEALLFVSDTPVDAAQFAKALNLSPAQIDAGLERLALLYRREDRGLRLMDRGGRYQLVTMPEAAGIIEDYLNLDLSTRLSGPALETLAVIAYRQPVTRAQVEAVRGVDCSGVLRSLLQRGLIEDAGRLETVGRPILYSVTDLFMQHFGLTGMNELPELKTDEADTLWAATELALDADALPGDALPDDTDQETDDWSDTETDVVEEDTDEPEEDIGGA